MTEPRAADCPDEDLGEYAAGRLDGGRRRRWDLHLVACRSCAHAVEEERRLQAVLAGAPSMPGELRATLLALAGGAAAAPAVPAHPGRRPDPLVVLSPDARPCHRSPLRATVVAAAAAGASAAAALSLTVLSTPVGRTGPAAATTVPVAGSPAPAPTPATTFANVVTVGWSRTPAPAGTGGQAESRP